MLYVKILIIRFFTLCMSQAVCGVEVRILTIHVPLRVKLYSKFNFIYISLETYQGSKGKIHMEHYSQLDLSL